MLSRKTPNYLTPIAVVLTTVVIIAFGLYIASQSLIYPDLNQINRAKKVLKSNNLVSYFEPTNYPKPKITPTDPINGDPKAPVIIFEYANFGCQYSAQMQPIIAQILKKYPKQVALVWKDLPLNNENDLTYQLHKAARCAQEQGKFWDYQEVLWSKQKSVTSDQLLLKIAGDLKLDKTTFSKCLNDSQADQLIAADVNEANSLLIVATPHFYINQQEIMGLASFADLDRLIQTELTKLKLNK